MKVLFQWAVSRHGTASDLSLTKNQERERVNILNVLFLKYTNKKLCSEKEELFFSDEWPLFLAV